MGILRVRNLISPPYVSTQPSLNVRQISKSDHFVIVGSDGLFDFFSNDEVVKLVHSYILSNSSGDPAKFLLEQLLERAAECAGKPLDIFMWKLCHENSSSLSTKIFHSCQFSHLVLNVAISYFDFTLDLFSFKFHASFVELLPHLTLCKYS